MDKNKQNALIRFYTKQLQQIFGNDSKQVKIFQRICQDFNNAHLIKRCYIHLINQQETEQDQ